MKYLLSIIFILIFSLSAFGQTFSSDWQKVPITFQGDDFEKIYKTLSDSPNLKDKSEYETTAEYQKRVTDLTKIALSDKSAASVLAFVYRPERIEFSRFLTAKYDADAQNLQITIIAASDRYVANAQRLEFTEIMTTPAKNAQLKSLGTYEGSNAYGLKRTIEKSLLKYYSVGITNFKSIQEPGKSKYDFGLTSTLSAAPAKAKEIKENLAILYVGKLVAPFSALIGDSLKPTVDKPRDVAIGNYILTMNLSEIWLYNAATGEILSKFKSK
jgi:hypothetical protein